MLTWMFILFFFLALIMILLSISLENKNSFWNIVGAIVSSVLWLILSLTQMEIEIPYTAIRSNDTIVTGVHTYTSPISPYLTYFFVLLFWLCFIYLIAMVYDKYINRKEM